MPPSVLSEMLRTLEEAKQSPEPSWNPYTKPAGIKEAPTGPLAPSEFTSEPEGRMTPMLEADDFIPTPNKIGKFGLTGAAGMIGVLPGKENLARTLNKFGLKGPWFHGTKRPYTKLPELKDVTIDHYSNIISDINAKLRDLGGNQEAIKRWMSSRGGGTPEEHERLRYIATQSEALRNTLDDIVFSLEDVRKSPTRPGGGFTLKNLGGGMPSGNKLGEPFGISLTTNPSTAMGFGTPLRVGVDIKPSQVADLLTPEGVRAYRTGYEKTLGERLPGLRPFKEMDKQKIIDEYINDFNSRLSRNLQSEGVEALWYNPHRYMEEELRVFDPDKTIPLGRLYNPKDPRVKHSETFPNIKRNEPEKDIVHRWQMKTEPTRRQRIFVGENQPKRISEVLAGLPFQKLSPEQAADNITNELMKLDDGTNEFLNSAASAIVEKHGLNILDDLPGIPGLTKSQIQAIIDHPDKFGGLIKAIEKNYGHDLNNFPSSMHFGQWDASNITWKDLPVNPKETEAYAKNKELMEPYQEIFTKEPNHMEQKEWDYSLGLENLFGKIEDISPFELHEELTKLNLKHGFPNLHKPVPVFKPPKNSPPKALSMSLESPELSGSNWNNLYDFQAAYNSMPSDMYNQLLLDATFAEPYGLHSKAFEAFDKAGLGADILGAITDNPTKYGDLYKALKKFEQTLED